MVLAHDISIGQRSQDIQISEDVTFDTMLLTSNTLQGLKSSGFKKPSPIQLHGIPMGKCGFDLLLEAKSGTGKTAVFSVIALEKLNLDKGLQAVILAPTREIASQICDVIKQIGSYYKGLNIEVVMGGLPVQDDICKFKNKVHIVVGSPGRLRHLIQDKYIDVSAVRLLVLDEADKLMEKSFQSDIRFIFSILPKEKQVIMSSATYSEYAKDFITNYVQHSQHICPNTNCILLGVKQKITLVKYNSNIVRQTQYRFKELLRILTAKQFKQCLLFCNYQVRVAEVHKLLLQNKWPAEQLYGQQEQTDRLDALKTLQEYKCRILICSDLAARGIDASNVDLVINFEPPLEWQTYLHRIGRAGRFGSYGMSITILSEGKEEEKFKRMLILMKNTLNIKELWSDNDINFDPNLHIHPQPKDVCILPESDIKTTKYEELWHILSEDTMVSNNKLENFESLCKSYDKNSNKIDTFYTLLQSFQHNQNNLVDNNDYRVFKIKDISDNNVMSTLKNVKKIFNNTLTAATTKDTSQEKNNNFNTKLKNGTSNVEIFENVHQVNTDIQEIDISIKPCSEISKSKMPNEKRNSIINVTDDVSCMYNYERKNLKDNTDLSHSTKDALLAYNLPMAFSSSKNKYPNKAHIYSNRNETISGSGVKYNNTIDKNYPLQNNKLYYNINKKEKEQKCAANCKETKAKLRVKSNSINQSNHKYLYLQSNNGYKEYNTEEKNTNYTWPNQEYLEWYSQLKFRMKQIEQIVYFDELSKM
ncbi:probable ATP-dependent RNA helicase DDX20 [Galleria mellonella]|uniref:RNA helicase n=1 Tax=Galleria mellonella TaxID=7137 RepID=A0A6J1X786_GALME|nr:probable ATP-dependent RNA helicase DDX20 [Galleria mellonella]